MAKPHTPLVTGIYTADPSAHVFDGRIYIYPSHDLGNDKEDDGSGDHFWMEDYHVFSLESLDAEAVDEGEALHIKDVPWAREQMWAPDAATKNGKYYFYFPAKDQDGVFRIGAAVGDSPAGPFTPEADYIAGSFSIDPAVFVDDDGRPICTSVACGAASSRSGRPASSCPTPPPAPERTAPRATSPRSCPSRPS